MIICAVVSVFFLILFIFPYSLYPLTLHMFAARSPRRRDSGGPQRASLLFAAFNEERSLPAKLENLRAIRALHPDIEIIAYSDGSTDGTVPLLRAAHDVVTTIAGETRMGKATGMRRMVEQCRGDICIFTDANVIVEPEAIARLLAYFDDPDVGGVAGALHYLNDQASDTARVGGLYWRFEEWLKRMEARTGSAVSADGSIFACRRALYPQVPPWLLDDMIVSVSVILAGKMLVHAPDVIAHEKIVTVWSEEWRRKRRIACRAYLTHRYLWPGIRRHHSPLNLYKYISHKLLRWFGLPFLVLGVAFALAAAILAKAWIALGAAAVAAVAAGILALCGVRPFAVAGEALLMLTATFTGVLDAMRGRRYQIWNPANSRS